MPLDAHTAAFSAIARFHADYAAALDAGRYDDWLALFTDDGVYKIQPRENFDRGLPLCTLALEGQAMLRDRIYGVRETLFHDPYYQRHIIGPPRLLTAAATQLTSETNYLVIRTKHAQPSELLSAGRYLDRFAVQDDGHLLLAERCCVFDSELIPNSLIYPI